MEGGVPDCTSTILPRCGKSLILQKRSVANGAQDSPMAAHLGVNRTESKILQHFYWPRMRKGVAKFCKTCHICQMVGICYKKIKPVPLQPVTVIGEPFSKVIIDCVGPMPKNESWKQISVNHHVCSH